MCVRDYQRYHQMSTDIVSSVMEQHIKYLLESDIKKITFACYM